MSFQQETDFYFLGQRDYVQGVVIFEQFWRALASFRQPGSDSLGPVTISRLKFDNEVVHQGFIEVTTHTPSDGPLPQLAAEMSCRLADGQNVRVRLKENHERPVTARLDTDPKPTNLDQRKQTGDFSANARLPGPWDSVALIRAIVQLNKWVHLGTAEQTGGGGRVRWLYLEKMNLPGAEMMPQDVDIQLTHHMALPRRPELITLNQVQCTAGDWCGQARICYSMEKK